MMIAQVSGLVAIPDDLLSTEAAPLLCAGLTTFNGLRNSKARPGELVAIQGVGGLGHLGIQFARRMGFQVAAIGKCSRSLRTDDAKRSSLQNCASYWPLITRIPSRSGTARALWRKTRKTDNSSSQCPEEFGPSG
jgi:hypothetical protein